MSESREAASDIVGSGSKHLLVCKYVRPTSGTFRCQLRAFLYVYKFQSSFQFTYCRSIIHLTCDALSFNFIHTVVWS